MQKISTLLTDYIMNKGMIEEADREMYTYGFVIALEKGLSAIFSLFIAAILGMIIEGLLFFVIFIPLRAYAGGLHLEKFWSCFILSCLTFIIVLLTAKFITIPIYISFISIILFILFVYFLYPVENKNRIVQSDEDIYFKKKLMLYLIFNGIMAIVFLILGKDKYLSLITATLGIIVLTMIIGKYKNRNNILN